MSTTLQLTPLTLHYHQIARLPMQALFEEDPFRFQRFSLEAAGLFLDYSKNRITETTLNQLINFAGSLNLQTQIEDLFTGKPLNTTENRPALHTALRDLSEAALSINHINITAEIKQTLSTMEKWVTQLRSRQWLGYTQKPLTHIVHLGIGGSYLGPSLVHEALSLPRKSPHCHFIAGADLTELNTLLKHLNPQTTLFIIASKTFTTQETLNAANRAKTWLQQFAPTADFSAHFVALTAEKENALRWGISPEYILPLWDWVGGRFSVWSAIGLPIAFTLGMPKFKQLLKGAYEMDQHFRTMPFATNMPVILGLLSFWYTRFFNAHVHAVLPYDYRLRSLPRHLQQLSMESNGKRVQKDGKRVAGPTAPILFGEMGTQGQHSFHQLLFQGTHLIPCDFIAASAGSSKDEDRTMLLAHCLAQSRALMVGQSADEIRDELVKQGCSLEEAEILGKHKAIPGNQPSNTILMKELTAETLGALMALYEHKTFVESVLWQINPFDQWGVELGKNIAREIEGNLRGEVDKELDPSTQGLVAYISPLREPAPENDFNPGGEG